MARHAGGVDMVGMLDERHCVRVQRGDSRRVLQYRFEDDGKRITCVTRWRQFAMSHWKGCERCALIPKQRERHAAAADCAAGKSEFEKPYAWLRFQCELEYRLSGNLYCRFIPRIPDSCKTRVSQSRGFLTLLHIG